MPVVANADGSVDVSWSIPVFPNQTEFQVQRSADAGKTFALVEHVPLTAPGSDGARHATYHDAATIALGAALYEYRIDTPYGSNVVSVTTVEQPDVTPSAPGQPQILP